jgi:Ser-tRNA(Ala) deacylase AlaX
MTSQSTLEPTQLLYLENTYELQASATLTHINENQKGAYFICDQTIFYPKGGGQPADTGTITFQSGASLNVHFVDFDAETATVRHYTNSAIDACLTGKTFSMEIDEDRRLINTKAHTAGHLIDALVSEMAPELIGKIGSHDASEGCYVKFQGLLESTAADRLLETLNEKLNSSISGNKAVGKKIVDPSELTSLRLPDGYKLPEGKPCRVVQIDGFNPSPCGGTHVQSLGEFTEIIATKIGLIKKENVTKVSYRFT